MPGIGGVIEVFNHYFYPAVHPVGKHNFHIGKGNAGLVMQKGIAYGIFDLAFEALVHAPKEKLLQA